VIDRPQPLREAHAHLAALGQSLGLVSLADCPDLGACLAIVAREAAKARGCAGAAGWVRLTQARVNGWREQRWPTRSELDQAAGEVPCVVFSFDHHSAAANGAAMAAAGLRAGVPVPPNGQVIETAPGSGEASGLLLEQAAYAAWNACPEPTPQEQRGFVRAGLKHLAGLGYVEVHDLHSQEWLGPVLGEMERAGELTMRVLLYPPIARLRAVAADRAAWESARVVLAGGKLFADGTLNARTAHMLHRYAEPLLGMPRGQCMVAPAAIEAAVREADELGLHLAVHAIGDGAVRTVLDAIERAAPSRSTTGLCRVEHAEIIDATDVPRFSKLGVVCSVQPCHLLTDVEALNRFVPHRLERVLPLRELIGAGCKPGELLLFGSDAPIVRADPGDSIQAAVHRCRPGAGAGDAIAPAQAISEGEAWACFAPGGVYG
jgi:predicted amidohydrolase YtcJ